MGTFRIGLGAALAYAGALSQPVFAAGDAKGGGGGGGLMEIHYDTALWTVVVFVALLLILKKVAWGPILEGLHKREEAIHHAINEAKQLREENARSQADLKAKLDEAYAKIPQMMEEARREATALKEQLKAEGTAEVQKERQRLIRELEVARDQALQDLWKQAAQLATLISTKAIGRSLSIDDHHRLVDEAMAEMRAARSA